ncbi:hypothetical protein CgunFtcFv8_025900 [Champsocephalus gunnari]|uniref:Uncharacterized protein n=1 Tax=Champsocephalus gunnari TaxID=52237 RepID=A0AAN8CBN8_CHAGU|nr:hypothetical protein CgunFtcFv8_025900 [Champsocephalus gunnari]
MAKPSDLKMFLESSLNEIFKATVSNILDSVDTTLSEYQGTIHRIESENEGLKRLLLAQRSTESAARDPREQDATERFSSSEWNDYPFGSTQGTFNMSICSSDKKSFRRKQKDKTRENTPSSSFLLQPDHMEETQCVSTADSSLKKHLKMHATKEQKAQSEGSTSETETNRPTASETLSDTDRS